MQQRLATFEVPSAELDDVDMERLWNEWVAGLAEVGLRPADEPHSSTDDSVTYRVFEVAHDGIRHSLNFDLTKLGIVTAALVAAEAFSSALTHGLDLFATVLA